MDTKELFTRCLDQADQTFSQLTSDVYARATPDTDWDARALAGHMLYELSWIPDLLSGKTVAEVGDAYDGDLLGNNPASAWQQAADKAAAAVAVMDARSTAHLSYGDVPNDDYLKQVSGDLLIHSWDLAAALGLDRTLDTEAAAATYARMSADAGSLEGSGLFKPSVTVPDDADVTTKLVALTGRDPDWQP